MTSTSVAGSDGAERTALASTSSGASGAKPRPRTRRQPEQVGQGLADHHLVGPVGVGRPPGHQRRTLEQVGRIVRDPGEARLPLGAGRQDRHRGRRHPHRGLHRRVRTERGQLVDRVVGEAGAGGGRFGVRTGRADGDGVVGLVDGPLVAVDSRRGVAPYRHQPDHGSAGQPGQQPEDDGRPPPGAQQQTRPQPYRVRPAAPRRHAPRLPGVPQGGQGTTTLGRVWLAPSRRSRVSPLP